MDVQDMTHGTYSTYRNHNCRCEPCTAAHRERVKQEAESRRLRLAANPSLAPHGVVTTYNNWGCRCDPCSEASRAANRRYYARRRAA